MKEDGGNDSLAAAWGCTEAGIAGPTIIAGQYLSPATSNWTSVGFDHSSWTQGTGGVGYEDKPADSTNYTRTDQYRHQKMRCTEAERIRLVISGYRLSVQGQDIAALALNVRYDDGFVAYLNGTEVKRVNLADRGRSAMEYPAGKRRPSRSGARFCLESFDIYPVYQEDPSGAECPGDSGAGHDGEFRFSDLGGTEGSGVRVQRRDRPDGDRIYGSDYIEQEPEIQDPGI